MPVVQCNLHLFKDGLCSYLLDSKLLGNRGNHQFRFIDRCQRHKTNTIGEVCLHLSGNLKAQTGLADASSPKEREQTNIRMPQHSASISDFFLASDKWCESSRHLPHRSRLQIVLKCFT